MAFALSLISHAKVEEERKEEMTFRRRFLSWRSMPMRSKKDGRWPVCGE